MPAWATELGLAMLRNCSCVAMRSAADCSVSQTVWIMLEPVCASLGQTSFDCGVNVAFSLATMIGAFGAGSRHATRQ